MIYDVSTQAESILPLAAIAALEDQLDEYLLIGALARDLVCHAVAGLPITRRTYDLDISVAVANKSEYSRILRTLGKATTTGGPQRRIVSGFPVDVLPFGEIGEDDLLIEDGVETDLTGLAEAAATADTYLLGNGLAVICPTIDCMIALKIIAWRMRGSGTYKDAQDLALLLDATHSGPFEDRCWTQSAYGDRYEYDPDLVGPCLAGGDIARHLRETSLSKIVTALSDREVATLAARTPAPGFRPDQRRAQYDAILEGIELATSTGPGHHT